jgi:hypothetical protein
MENGTNGVSTETTATAEAAPAKGRRGRRKGSKAAASTAGLVTVGAKLPADIVRRLDAAAAASFRTRPSQIAFYISQGMAKDETSGS